MHAFKSPLDAIDSVPKFWTREQYMRLFEEVGIKPEDTQSLEFTNRGAYAVVFLRDEDGHRHMDGDERFAKNRIFIPVIDLEDEEAGK